MFKVELTQEEINTIGKYIDISLKREGIAILKESFVILSRLESATPVAPVTDETGPTTKKPTKSKE